MGDGEIKGEHRGEAVSIRRGDGKGNRIAQLLKLCAQEAVLDRDGVSEVIRKRVAEPAADRIVKEIGKPDFPDSVADIPDIENV